MLIVRQSTLIQSKSQGAFVFNPENGNLIKWAHNIQVELSFSVLIEGRIAMSHACTVTKIHKSNLNCVHINSFWQNFDHMHCLCSKSMCDLSLIILKYEVHDLTEESYVHGRFNIYF